MNIKQKNILITGANGFIGKNLLTKLNEIGYLSIFTFNRTDHKKNLPRLIEKSDIIIHLAGENRPKRTKDFETVNVGLTSLIANSISKLSTNKIKTMKLIHVSSAQVKLSNPYGLSKKKGEDIIKKMVQKIGLSTTIYRFPGVFGKWSRPNYNSVVSTFCSNVAQNLPLQIHDPDKEIELVYIDDVLDSIVYEMSLIDFNLRFPEIFPNYKISLSDLAHKIQSFRESRENLIVPMVGKGLDRALYSTYLSYIPSSGFSYRIPSYNDERGTFVEILKTENSGQVSFFTAHPGVTRGGHYHHTKNEKFLVITGKALFRFRNLDTGEAAQLITSGKVTQIVDTIPGWVHDITNIGNEELVVMLWANEIFDRHNPDTVASEL